MADTQTTATQTPAADTTAQTQPTADTTPAATTTDTTAAQPQPAQPTEPALTLESYKDLDSSDFVTEAGIEAEGLTSFKQLGLDNKISPDALKAVAKWSLDNIKAQQAEFAKVQAAWKAENEKKYGENLKNVKTNVGRVLADFDKAGTFASLLKDAGAEENPAVLEFLNSVADAVLEKGSINPNASPEGREPTLEDMYK